VFDGAKITSLKIIFLYIFLQLVLVLVFTTFVFPSHALVGIVSLSRGLINQTLIAGALELLILVGIVLLRVGKLSLADLGISLRSWSGPLLLVALLWILVQVVTMVLDLTSAAPLKLNPDWETGGTVVVGAFLAQIFGNSLVEEIGFRGFLFPQLLLRLQEFLKDPKGSFLLALFLSQGLFALYHLPILVYRGSGPTEILMSLPVDLLIGSYFAFIYLKTRNLLYVVGVHALIDAPLPLLAGAASFNDPGTLTLIVSLPLFLIWQYFFKNALLK
jgi:membrane protease YdiL (CAAX protease family)